MSYVEEVKEKVIAGGSVSREEALRLYKEDLQELCAAADEIRRFFCKDGFDLCSIVNGKSGKCSENCKFCAQSAHYHTGAEVYPMLDKKTIVKEAVHNAERGVLRYSIVTSGRALNDEEIDYICDVVREIRKVCSIEVCASFGLLNKEQFKKIKEAGVSRIHNNLEASRNYFGKVCTSHSYDDKIRTIENAREAGLSVCSGGIMGLGEAEEDRIDMAMTLRELNIKSVPVNMLNPIPGTPFADHKRLQTEDMQRIVAVYRFILPDASIRLAGGRGLLENNGRKCFESGANAVITGDMLTTSGYTVESDLKMIKELGFKPELWDR